jgi:rod shape-determining protein MreD
VEPAVVIRLRLPLMMLLVLTVQKSMLNDVDVRDVRPDALLLFVVCAGLVGGSEVGAVVGFVVGLVADLFVLAPLGLSSLVFSLVGYAVGTLRSTLIREVWWMPPVTAFVASAGGVALYAVLGAVLGHGEYVRPQLVATALLVGAMNSVLSLALVRLTGWALQGQERYA